MNLGALNLFSLHGSLFHSLALCLLTFSASLSLCSIVAALSSSLTTKVSGLIATDFPLGEFAELTRVSLVYCGGYTWWSIVLCGPRGLVLLWFRRSRSQITAPTRQIDAKTPITMAAIEPDCNPFLGVPGLRVPGRAPPVGLAISISPQAEETGIVLRTLPDLVLRVFRMLQIGRKRYCPRSDSSVRPVIWLRSW